MKIDLHVHIHRTSRCAKEEPESMAAAALARGIQGIVILDHNYQATKEDCLKAEIAAPGIKIFRGIELNVVSDDVVVISTHIIEHPPKYKERINDIKTLAEWVDKTNSLAILAHPFRRHDISIDLNVFRPQAIELASRHVVKENRAKIAEVAKQYGMKCVSVSDAHKGKQLGGFCIDTDKDINNEEELICAVKKGEFTLLESRLTPVDIYSRNIGNIV